MQVVRPVEHPPATAEPAPSLAPIMASLWSPLCAEGMKGSSSQEGEHEGDPEPGWDCAGYQLCVSASALLYHLAPLEALLVGF